MLVGRRSAHDTTALLDVSDFVVMHVVVSPIRHRCRIPFNEVFKSRYCETRSKKFSVNVCPSGGSAGDVCSPVWPFLNAASIRLWEWKRLSLNGLTFFGMLVVFRQFH